MKKIFPILVAGIFILTGCTSMKFSSFSRSLDTVNEVELNRYLGTWYEYARLDVPFEKGMTKTQANYSLMDPDKEGRPRIRVVNSGMKKGKFKKAKAKAVIPDPDEPGRIQVSFFGPFYSDYNIIALDTADYQWSLVSGSSRDYLWVLSRKPQLDPAVFAKLKAIAGNYGFDTSALIFPQ
ncbi:MAG: lipocalin family protein [Candidatus Marinimicrobia bacterium]|nr:lipocalin family protein [Candidatus Neomarinimicrobiota bacterium]